MVSCKDGIGHNVQDHSLETESLLGPLRSLSLRVEGAQIDLKT